MLKIKLLFLSFLLIGSISAQQSGIMDEIDRIFKKYNHNGCFVLYDSAANKYLRYNPDKCETRYIPASTFKIFNSLAGLETGVVKDEFEIFKWDSVKRFIDVWNQDLDLQQAFKYSAVWVYQEIARRIGEERMKNLITANHYGNENIGGGIDRFWLDGDLKISPNEQIEFLKKLHDEQLKFSERSMRIVKKIMLHDKNEQYSLFAKTGWAIRVEDQVGWFVGFVQTKNNVYYFTTNIVSKQPEEGFASRKNITYDILKYLNIID